MPEPSPISESFTEPSTVAMKTAPPEHVAEVLDVVRELLGEVIGPEYLVGITIDLDTSFDEDLELESVEFVALNEKLRARYGEQVDFIAWLSTKELDEIIGLDVGDLVRFVAASVTTA